MVIMASGIACGRVRTTTTTATESRNMAAKHQIYETCSIGFPCTSLMLCSIETCQFKVSADQYYVTISHAQVGSSSRSRVLWKLTTDRVLVFYWIAGSCWVCLKQGQVVHNASPVLKVNRIIP